MFTPRKVGNIVCQVLREAAKPGVVGANLPEVKRQLRIELNRCFPCEEPRQEEKSLTAAAVAIAQQAFAENSEVLAIAIAVLTALFILPRLIQFIPPALLTLLPIAGRLAIQRVPAVLQQLRAAKAANDFAWRRVVGL